jgi:hypothetical protein
VEEGGAPSTWHTVALSKSVIPDAAVGNHMKAGKRVFPQPACLSFMIVTFDGIHEY